MRRMLAGTLVVAAFTACHNPDAYVIGPDSVDAVLAVSVASNSLPANGIARTTITVHIDPRTDASKRTVSFSTSAGILIGGGKEGTTTTVTADAGGTAVAELRSATTPGSARVDVSIGTISRTTIVEFVAVDSSEIITVSADTTSIAADSASPVSIVARVAAGLSAERRKVTFRTTLGKFAPGNSDSLTIDADAGNLARATLIGSTTGVAQVTASTGDGVSAAVSVTFTQALPDSLFVSPTAATLAQNESTRVVVTLLRTVGKVSPRLQVSYSASTSSGASIGVFSGMTLSNDDGVSEATFNVPTTMYLGPVTIRATVGNKEGTATIEIVP